MVAKADIVAAGYDLSLNRDKEGVHTEVIVDRGLAASTYLLDLNRSLSVPHDFRSPIRGTSLRGFFDSRSRSAQDMVRRRDASA